MNLLANPQPGSRASCLCLLCVGAVGCGCLGMSLCSVLLLLRLLALGPGKKVMSFVRICETVMLFFPCVNLFHIKRNVFST